MASYWITAAGVIIFQLETSYLTSSEEMSRFAFRQQQSRKTRPVVVEMTVVCLRRVVSLARIKQIAERTKPGLRTIQ